jgi:hypothetical protein
LASLAGIQSRSVIVFPNHFRRIALAQGLLAAQSKPQAAPDLPPVPQPPPVVPPPPRLPEPADMREQAG